jgi:hypothetical protein
MHRRSLQDAGDINLKWPGSYFLSFYYYSLAVTCFDLTTIFRWKYIHRKLTLLTTDIRILVNLIYNGDRFLVTVSMVDFGELTVARCCRSWCALSMFLV